MEPGPRNLITDVGGIAVGNAADPVVRSGVTVVLCEPPATASVHIVGGAPGTRDTDLLTPDSTIPAVDAIVLSGGSAFGLDAATGVQALLRERGAGFELAERLVPIVPAAILFDLANGGDKRWGRYPPYRELAYAATQAVSADFAIGSQGAGFGALCAGLKGGLGSASLRLPDGTTIAALIAVNSIGAVTVGETGHFWAAPFEIGDEFGGLGWPAPLPADATAIRLRGRPQAGANTAVGIVATDAVLTKAQARRLAIVAHDGIARAIWPAHLPFDGDSVFALATGTSGTVPDADAWADLCAHAGTTTSRAIARGVFAATAAPGDLHPSWRERFGGTG